MNRLDLSDMESPRAGFLLFDSREQQPSDIIQERVGLRQESAEGTYSPHVE